jgi:hypothetical protein
MPNGLTVLAALQPGAEEPLRQVLRAIGDDIKGRTLPSSGGRPHIDFCRSRTIHFARFAILDDPDRGPDRRRLLFSSNYDGDLDSHLAELIQMTSGMDAIWGGCEDYAGVAAFPAFIRAHACAPDAFYIAFRDESVERIQRAIAIRQQTQALLESAPAAALARLATRDPGEGPSTDLVRGIGDVARWSIDALRRLVRAAPVAVDPVRAVVRLGLADVFRGTNRIIASLNRYPVFRFANWITSNRMPARTSPYSGVTVDNLAPIEPLVPGDEVPSILRSGTPPAFREDVVTQNQLTLITVVNPKHVNRVKAVMSAIDSYAKRLAPPGSLIGISTIHFVRWLLIDNGRRLMMVSDYDGSWESYIDEFAEMILSGLDAIWETSFGFPPDGARDLPAFKRFLRTHQVPSDVFFSAYPAETVLNVRADLTLARAWTDAIGPTLQRLLEQ